MYHGRFKKSHYEAGYRFGVLSLKNGHTLNDKIALHMTQEKRKFMQKCLPFYQKEYPEILEEIKGIADGQGISYEDLLVFLLTMYCFDMNFHCTCFAYADENQIIFGRNSDFLIALEKLYMNCLYQLGDVYHFQGNTTAFVEMEDGINEHGLAVGLTFICPTQIKPGLNAGMLVRYLLEKCKTTKEAIAALKRLPIASSQTITLADCYGDIVVVECDCEGIEMIRPKNNENFVVTTNHFHSKTFINKRVSGFDDWNSDERYHKAYLDFKEIGSMFSMDSAVKILSDTSQRNRKNGGDTVWSVIYDIKNKSILRVEGNPSRKKYKKDERWKLK